MLITKKYIAFVFALQKVISQKLNPRARILEVETHDESETERGVKAQVKVWFGPTHQLTFVFDGTVNTKDCDLGEVWSLTYDDGEIKTTITTESLYNEDNLARLKNDLGI